MDMHSWFKFYLELINNCKTFGFSQGILLLLDSLFNYYILVAMKKIFFAMVVLTVSCSAKKQPNNQSDEFLSGIKLAELKNKELKEISGIATSINNPKL